MKKIILLMLMLAAIVQAKEVHKVVFDLTTGNLQAFEQKVMQSILSTKEYYAKNDKELDVVVIIHGDSYKFFLKDLSKSGFKYKTGLNESKKSIEKRLKYMTEHHGVKFLLCSVGATKFKIKRENIYDFVEMTPSAVIALIAFQNDGYAFLPID